jgi:plasmid replication initiation protein
MEENKSKLSIRASLVQPNKVTTARYDFSAVQENALTAIISAIQDHMTQVKPIQTDLFGHPTVKLLANELSSGNNKYYVLKQLKGLRQKDIDFTWLNPETGKQEEVTTGLISTIRNITDTDEIDVEISVWAIPYLLYWGKGTGGTIYQKSTALTLKGEYTKRLYKLCCRWKDKGGFSMDLDEFRQMFKVEQKYPQPIDLKRRILDPAKKRLKEEADVYFDYSLSKIKSRSYNVITFKIFDTGTKSQKQEVANQHYRAAYLLLTRIWPNYESDKAMQVADKLSEQGQLQQVLERMSRLDDDLTQGKLNGMPHYAATAKKILKEDYMIE